MNGITTRTRRTSAARAAHAQLTAAGILLPYPKVVAVARSTSGSANEKEWVTRIVAALTPKS